MLGNNSIANRLAKQYGIPVEKAAAVLAVLSPGKNWNQNVSLAERVLRIYKDKEAELWTNEMSQVAHGQRSHLWRKLNGVVANDLSRIEGKAFSELTDPRDKAMWIRLFDEAHGVTDYEELNPLGKSIGFATNKNGARTKIAWTRFDDIEKAVKAIEANDMDEISASLGQGHKVRNFYNNIVDPWNKGNFVTVDTHAVAGGLARPLSNKSLAVRQNFGGLIGASPLSGMSGTYGIYHEAMEQAARARGYLNANQMQSVIWEAARNLFDGQAKGSAAQARAQDIWRSFAKGKHSREEAIRRIMDLAGGISNPKWMK